MTNHPEKQALIDAGDYRDYVITEVRHIEGTRYVVECSGTGFQRDFKGAVPQVMDHIRMFTQNLSRIQGIDLNGVEVDFLTKAQMDAEQAETVARIQADRLAKFDQQKPDMDKQFSELPPAFQTRIQIFRDHCPTFRWEYEPYELHCCTDAANIIDFALGNGWDDETGERLGWEDGATPPFQVITPNSTTEDVATFIEYLRADKGAQQAVFGDLEGESGNTFGSTLHLAQMGLLDHIGHRPEGFESTALPLVVMTHGALTPLVGCGAYGCVHPRPEVTA